MIEAYFHVFRSPIACAAAATTKAVHGPRRGAATRRGTGATHARHQIGSSPLPNHWQGAESASAARAIANLFAPETMEEALERPVDEGDKFRLREREAAGAVKRDVTVSVRP